MCIYTVITWFSEIFILSWVFDDFVTYKMQEEKFIFVTIQSSCGPSVPSGIKKVIHILQLKYPIRFAQALFKPKSNSSEKLHIHEVKRVINRKPLKVFNLTFHDKWGPTQVLGHWGKSGMLVSKTPNHGHVIESVKLDIWHEMKPYSSGKFIWESIYTCFINRDKSGKLGPNNPNHGKYTESYPKCKIPHFTSNKTLFKCKDHLRVELNLF